MKLLQQKQPSEVFEFNRFTLFWIFLAFLISPQTAIAAPQAGFDCKKASTKVEKLICSNDDLAALDHQLAPTVAEVKVKYEGDLLQHFLQGQRIWLKLRDEACLVNENKLTPALQTKCLTKVYRERLKELREQSGATSASDIDEAMDQRRELTAYHPEDMSSMYFQSADGPDFGVKRIPRTCRELFTLTSGVWDYSTDTIGENSQANAFTSCQSALLNATAAPAVETRDPVDFKDMTLFSNEFVCLSRMTDDADSPFKEYPISFRELQRKGLLKIKKGAPPSDDETARPTGAPTLYIEKERFSLSETHYRVEYMGIGNFTHRNRQEALLIITNYPYVGTYRSTQLILAYYDEPSRSIRLETFERPIGFIPKPTPLAADFCGNNR